ncbi:MAG: NUDIX domain-containing protein [[Clostridium] innocuum]
MEPGETWEQAVIREAMEELSCVKLNNTLQRFVTTERIAHLKVHAYLCKYIRGDIRLHAH